MVIVVFGEGSVLSFGIQEINIESPLWAYCGFIVKEMSGGVLSCAISYVDPKGMFIKDKVLFCGYV